MADGGGGPNSTRGRRLLATRPCFSYSGAVLDETLRQALRRFM